jgi:CRP-like cAMP-binding protein
VDRIARDPVVYDDRLCLIAAVDILADLTQQEMRAIAQAAPMRTNHPGEMLFTPHQPTESLFILKRGPVRIFRVSADGGAITTAIITPGTIFGEMVLLGQKMYDNWAEALDEALVCPHGPRRCPYVAARGCAHRHPDRHHPRWAPGGHGATVDRGGVQDRAAARGRDPARPAGRTGASAGPVVVRRKPIAITHEQLAALVGTSRETATKALGDLSDHGVIKLGRGKITVLDHIRLADERALT